MASTDRNVAVGGAGGAAAEDLIASSSSLWPPRTVVKRHRKKATLLWLSLLVAFCVYVGYIVWDTVDSRKNPAASVQLKQSPFTFPDVAVCTTFLNGCLSETANCLKGRDFSLHGLSGFMEEKDDFDLEDYPDVAKVREAFSHCAVMPLSQLTVNETGVENGDITYFSASLFLQWDEDPDDEFDATEHTIFTQYVSTHFIDIAQDVDEIEGKVVDVKLPYSRVTGITGEWFTSTRNHMVISLSEFSGITKNGDRKEREQTYSQTTTSATDNWYWTGNSTSVASILQIEMLITKFEYTTVEEVDPVDMWAIIGAIGGVWQFVAVAFGVFFVFSEKQPPDKKMRDLYDTVVGPAAKINRRLSSITSSARSSQQDIEVDAADEDLPPGWVKKQRKGGSVYYFHTMTGATSVSAPDERDEPSLSTAATATSAPRRHNAIRSLFRVAHDSQSSGIGGLQDSTNGTNDVGSLPPGWLERTDGDGRVYYMDTVSKMTQWNRPALRVHSSSGSSSRSVQAVDIPVRRVRRGSSTTSSLGPAPPTIIPPTATTTAAATGGGVVGEPLPPHWETRTTPDGRTYYANTVTKKTQWETPCNPL